MRARAGGRVPSPVRRWVLFPPTWTREEVKGRAFVHKDRGEDDEAIDYFNNILPRIRSAAGKQRVRLHTRSHQLVQACMLGAPRRCIAPHGALRSRRSALHVPTSARPYAGGRYN